MLLRCLTATLLILMSASAAHAADLRVMTRNLYLGGDLVSLAEASTPGEFAAAAQAVLAQIAASNFPVRADALAAEIADQRPHLVGLQEVYDFTLNGAHGSPPFRDYLADLLAALAARGATYYVAATVTDLDVSASLGPGTVGRVVDHDVILARADVPTSIVPLECSDPARASADGCNFAVVASFVSPVVGPIAFERGYLAVTAVVDGQPVVVVETHLEQRLAAYPVLALVQFYQALELAQVSLALQEALGAPVVIAGDLNSSPEHETVVVGTDVALPPYVVLAGAGYTDTWLLRPGKAAGKTCCQLPDLSNPTSVLYERVDLILSSDVPVDVRAHVLGDSPSDKTSPLRLWPSDHAGVVATLSLVP